MLGPFLCLPKNQYNTQVEFRRKSGRKKQGRKESASQGGQRWEAWTGEGGKGGGIGKVQERGGMVLSVNEASYTTYSLLDQSVWSVEW